MKKAVLWQFVVTIITLAIYFIILHSTGDKKIIGVFVAIVAAVISFGAWLEEANEFFCAISIVLADAITVTLIIITTNIFSIIADVLFFAIGAISIFAFILDAVDDLKISYKKAIFIYGTQFTVILAVMLLA